MKRQIAARQGKNYFKRIIEYVVIFIALSQVLIPLFWLFTTSLKNPVDIFTYPPVWIPKNITLNHYRSILQVNGVLPYFINSVIIALSSTLMATVFGGFAAYSLARVRFPFKLGIFLVYWILMTRMYPAVCTAIAYFMIIQRLGLLDTRLALSITYTSFNLPFVIWILLGFFGDIPRSIEESAIMDGATFFERFVRVVIPISIPGLVVAAVFSFILAWNEFLFAVILTTYRAQTVPVVISGFITDRGLEWGQMTGMGVMAIIPVLIFALIIQKNFVKGLAFGAVKE
jgi:multiple sugar transport system permease protein